jgi:hypothetical protein
MEKPVKVEVPVNAGTFCKTMKYSNMIEARLRSHMRRENLEEDHTMTEWKKIYKNCMKRVTK